MPASVPVRLLARLRGEFVNGVTSGSVTYRTRCCHRYSRNDDNVVVFPEEHNDNTALAGKGLLGVGTDTALR